MCEQAARYCRDGVHKLLNKEQGKLRAQESREQPQPVAGQDSESATAAQSGNSGAQPGGGIDGLVRWIVTKMSDNKNISSREYASSKEEVAVAQEQFFAPEPRRGISVILDVSSCYSGRLGGFPTVGFGHQEAGRGRPVSGAQGTGAVRTVYARMPGQSGAQVRSSEPTLKRCSGQDQNPVCRTPLAGDSWCLLHCGVVQF